MPHATPFVLTPVLMGSISSCKTLMVIPSCGSSNRLLTRNQGLGRAGAAYPSRLGDRSVEEHIAPKFRFRPSPGWETASLMERECSHIREWYEIRARGAQRTEPGVGRDRDSALAPMPRIGRKWLRTGPRWVTPKCAVTG